jgi:hypothetical protein
VFARQNPAKVSTPAVNLVKTNLPEVFCLSRLLDGTSGRFIYIAKLCRFPHNTVTNLASEMDKQQLTHEISRL